MKEVLDRFESYLDKESWQSQPFKRQAWERLINIGLPHRKEEAFQYVSLRKLYDSILKETPEVDSEPLSSDFSSMVLPECHNSYLVFKDGMFSRELSCFPDSIVILPFEEALKGSYGHFLKHRLQTQVAQEKDPWALLSSAFSQAGVFIYVPPKIKVLPPLQIIHLQSDSSPFYVGSRIHLVVGAHSDLEMVSSFYCSSKRGTLYNDFLDVSLEEKAHFSHLYSQQEYSDGWCFSSLRATLKKDSHLESNFVTFGYEGFRRDYSVFLLGEGSKAELKGLSALDGQSESHMHIHVQHVAPNCESNQFFKNVLSGRSRSSFTGKIYVEREAQKTQAYQLNQNLLLSDQAAAHTKPNLEIFADDVKASHGATIAQLDDEQIFYLRTRGIPLQEAKSLLTIGFSQEILDGIRLPSLRDRLSALTRSFLLKQG